MRFPDVDSLVSGSHEHHRSILLKGMTWLAPVNLPLVPPVCSCRTDSEPRLDWVPVLLSISACCCCRRPASELCSIPASRAGPRALLAHCRCRLGPDRTRPSVSPAIVSTRSHHLWRGLLQDAPAIDNLLSCTWHLWSSDQALPNASNAMVLTAPCLLCRPIAPVFFPSDCLPVISGTTH